MTEQTPPLVPIQIRRERDFGAILGLVFEFIRANAKLFLKSLLFIAGPVALLAGAGQGLYFSALFGLSEFAGTEDPGPSFVTDFVGSIAPAVGITIVFTIVGLTFLYALAPNFVLLYMQRGTHGFDVADVWASVKQDFWRVLGTIVVTTLAMLAPAVALLALAMMSDTVLLIVPAFLVALPIALYLYTIFTLTVPIRVVERLGIGESIRRSFELISGKWWFTFWLFFVLWMIIGILMMIFQIPMQVVMMSAFFGGDTNSGGTAMVILGTIAGALAQLVYSLFALASTLQYFNLVEMKEGVGMQDRIREIGGGSSDARALG